MNEQVGIEMVYFGLMMFLAFSGVGIIIHGFSLIKIVHNHVDKGGEGDEEVK